MVIAVNRLKKSLAQQGLKATVYKFYAMLVDPFFDLSHGTDTRRRAWLKDLTIRGRNKERGKLYQATRVKPLRALFKSIVPMIPANSVLVDFGCGKGRVLMVAANSGFASVRGIEFAHELCEIAKENCEIYKRRTGLHTEFQIVESDAVEYPIRSDENVFFLFHPFDDVILKEILGNIVTSLESQQRRVLIIYNNPKHGHVIEQQDGFAKLGEYILYGSRFTLYSNSDQAGVAGLDW